MPQSDPQPGGTAEHGMSAAMSTSDLSSSFRPRNHGTATTVLTSPLASAPARTSVAQRAALAREDLSRSNGRSAIDNHDAPVRPPLLPDHADVRLLSSELMRVTSERDHLRSQLSAWQNRSWDLREARRSEEEAWESRRLEQELRRDRDATLARVDEQREIEWGQKLAAVEAELAKATRKAHEVEDALYAERSNHADFRATAAQRLTEEQSQRREVEQQLQAQARSANSQLSEMQLRCEALSSDLQLSRQRALALEAEKDALFTELYAGSRIGPDRSPSRPCRSPEAALLELQRTEIAQLRSRVEQENTQAEARQSELWEQLRTALGEQQKLRDQVEELKGTLRKCTKAMESMQQEQESWRAKERERIKMEAQKQQPEQEQLKQSPKPHSSAGIYPHSQASAVAGLTHRRGSPVLHRQAQPSQHIEPEQPLQQHALPQHQGQLQQSQVKYPWDRPEQLFLPLERVSAEPAVAPVVEASPATTATSLSDLSDPPRTSANLPILPAAPSAPITTPTSGSVSAPSVPLSSHEVLVQTQQMLLQQQADTEARRQRRQERRQALWGDGATMDSTETSVAAATAAAAAAAHPVAPIAASHEQPLRAGFQLDLTRVDGWSGSVDATGAQSSVAPALTAATAAAAVSAAPMGSRPPHPLVAQPARPLDYRPLPSLGLLDSREVLGHFDFSYMDSEGARGTQHVVKSSEPLRSGALTVAPSLATDRVSVLSLSDSQMQQALEQAVRAVEVQQRQQQQRNQQQSRVAPQGSSLPVAAAAPPLPSRTAVHAPKPALRVDPIRDASVKSLQQALHQLDRQRSMHDEVESEQSEEEEDSSSSSLRIDRSAGPRSHRGGDVAASDRSHSNGGNSDRRGGTSTHSFVDTHGGGGSNKENAQRHRSQERASPSLELTRKPHASITGAASSSSHVAYAHPSSHRPGVTSAATPMPVPLSARARAASGRHHGQPVQPHAAQEREADRSARRVLTARPASSSSGSRSRSSSVSRTSSTSAHSTVTCGSTRGHDMGIAHNGSASVIKVAANLRNASASLKKHRQAKA